MDKEQRLYNFWNGFATAYDVNSVPDEAPFPRITFEVQTDNLGYPVSTSASIWTRSSSWQTAENIKAAIEHRISRGGIMLGYDGGAMWLKRGTPFSVRGGDPSDDKVRQIMLNIEIEYIE